MKRRFSLVLLLSLLGWITARSTAQPIPLGRGQVELSYQGAPLSLYTYKPANYKEGPLVIVFHGIVRNAENYRDFAIPLAERFDASPEGMKQGPHRLARNRTCFELAQKMARERGWTFNWRKVETPGIEHDATRMFAAAEMDDALFGPKP